MPLKKGSDKTTIGHNIRKLVGEGRDVEQSVAIAYKTAGREHPSTTAKRKKNKREKSR